MKNGPMAKHKKETSHNVDFAKGGKTKMFGEQHSEDQTPGETRDADGDAGGPGEKFAKGGSSKMFGFAGSMPATAGKTSAR